MTDLCWYCQKHTTMIQRSINRPEEEKTQVNKTCVNECSMIIESTTDSKGGRRTP